MIEGLGGFGCIKTCLMNFDMWLAIAYNLRHTLSATGRFLAVVLIHLCPVTECSGSAVKLRHCPQL